MEINEFNEKNEFNNNDNNTNKKLEFLYEKYQLLEKENKKNNERIIKNEVNIKNLSNLLKFIRKEYKEEIQDLKKYILQLFQKFQELFKNNQIDKESDNNEIIINDKNEDLKIIISIYEEMDKMFDKKLAKFEEEFFLIRKKQKKKKDDKKEEKKEDKNLVKKENKKEEKKWEKDKEKKILEKLENRLENIFFDQNKIIDINDMNELKKIYSAIIIKGGQPLKIINEKCEKYVTNNFDEQDEEIKDRIVFKKVEILSVFQDFSIIKNIEEENINEYIKKFREKYGITEKDYNDKDLTKLINKKHHDDKNILTEILKKLKYLK